MEQNKEAKGHIGEFKEQRLSITSIMSTESRRSTLRNSAYVGSIPRYEMVSFMPKIERKMQRLYKRHNDDAKFLGDFDLTELKDQMTYKRQEEHADANDIILRYPSYSKFKLPLDAECLARYKECTKKYNRQFRNEIIKLVDYQCSALEAAYLVRVAAYTTIWPPYHNETEIKRTSQTFFRLTPEEQKRFTKITGMPYKSK